MLGIDYLGKNAIARTGAYLQTEIGKGKVIAYCDAPTVTIQRTDGSHFNWRADLCEFLPSDDEIIKKRIAAVAEGKFDK